MKDFDKQKQQLHGKFKASATQSDHDFLSRILNGDEADVDYENDEDFPLVDLPPGLDKKLYAIADTNKNAKSDKNKAKSNRFWPTITSIAAAVLIGLFFIEQARQPSEQDIQRAKQELAIAFAYLNAANKTTNTKVKQTLNARLQQASVNTVFNVVASTKSEDKEKL